MFHAPINGSQINTPAKLYKRFTTSENITLDGTVIAYENNYYRFLGCAFAWVDADDMQTGEEQPIRGVLAHSDRMTIKFYGRWKSKPSAGDEPEAGDILFIGGERWIIEDGVQRARKKSLVDFAVVFLPIRKLL